MERIFFEFKYGASKNVTVTYHEAITTLNKMESDKFAEEYIPTVRAFNQRNNA